MNDDEKQEEIVHVLDLVVKALSENTPKKQKERNDEINGLRTGISVLLYPMFLEYISNESFNPTNYVPRMNEVNFDNWINNIIERFEFAQKNVYDYNSNNSINSLAEKYRQVLDKFIEKLKDTFHS